MRTQGERADHKRHGRHLVAHGCHGSRLLHAVAGQMGARAAASRTRRRRHHGAKPWGRFQRTRANRIRRFQRTTATGSKTRFGVRWSAPPGCQAGLRVGSAVSARAAVSMGCAQSRDGGYYYPSFLEGPVDRINSSDPQSAVDFVDRVLDQIDLALDGERPTPTRTFTAAEAEVVETAWRAAGLLPDSRISLRQFQALLPMVLSEAPFHGLDLDVLQDHISAERLSQRRKDANASAGGSRAGTGAAQHPDAAPAASTTLACPPLVQQQQQQQQQSHGDSDWQTVLDDPGGAGSGACVGGWSASACSAAGGAEQAGGDEASGLGAHHDHAQLSLKVKG